MTTFGARPNGIYVARFRNVKEQHPHFVRGYGFQGDGVAKRVGPGPGHAGLGRRVQGFAHPRAGTVEVRVSAASAECLPRSDNFVAIHPTLTDKWGIPALHIHCTWGPNELALLEDMQQTAAEMLEAAGATDIETVNEHLAPGLCIHEMGTARMGRDPKTSVLNGWNQCLGCAQRLRHRWRPA